MSSFAFKTDFLFSFAHIYPKALGFHILGGGVLRRAFGGWWKEILTNKATEPEGITESFLDPTGCPQGSLCVSVKEITKMLLLVVHKDLLRKTTIRKLKMHQSIHDHHLLLTLF